MNRRLYFVLPDVATAAHVEHDLLLARIEDRRMHFIGKRDTDFGDLPEATYLQKSDIRHGLFVGMVSGGVTGIALGALLYNVPDLIGIALAPAVILIMGLVGAFFGAATSGLLIGSSTPNIHLREFDEDFEAGRVVLMLDVPKQRVEEVSALIARRYPEARNHGVDATVPAFP